jgi:hypothetical protein
MSDSFDKFLEQGEQQSIEWLTSRIGHATGSRFDDVIRKLKSGKPSAARYNYMMETVIERLTNKPSNYYFSTAMQWGLANEPAARCAYEAKTGALVEQVGFKHHPSIEWCGVSSDGIADDDRTIEIKCPYNPFNHIETILNGMPEEHMAQVQGGLDAWGFQSCDFISFDPRMPEDLQLYVQNIAHDRAYITAMQAEIIVFLQEVAAMVEKLKAIK